MLRLFRTLMPKEDQFFHLFEEHSRTVLAGAEALRATLAGGPDIEQNITNVMNREDDADRITGEVLAAIRRSFITPFDRGDIKDLITSMDDAIDQMRKTVKSVALFKVTRFEPEMIQMADCIVQGAQIVQEVIPMLRSVGTNAGRISTLSEHMTQIEGQTDDLHDAARSRMFQAMGSAHALDFWVASEILDHLERVMDRLEDVVHEVHSIVIEHV
ncbi:DUF47 domain-containing protein [Microvirga sp. G4-2]|uniref:DUF47 domain-containing protein n=1 Tax=Microvirga sp. G4-2 TaxID=3434467 RepID=UPI0040446454